MADHEETLRDKLIAIEDATGECLVCNPNR